ncbi:MAG: saccharopine dehydrogenase NADP-binding domain-containing protein [Pseudomonadales bacterium]|nr:saccharopine dehydrogenase NADP-binding domain-containing protein [Pseudomonadales bacterium]
MKMNWMIYGANGYTGELIARAAVKRGLKPTLAGRNRTRVESLAQELGLKALIFGLDQSHQVAKAIEGQHLVMHCAGPFSATSRPMMEGCIKAGAHYLDITGEIDVFELGQSMHKQARDAGIVICPGVGFDVIPTDCVAAALKQTMPDATYLALGFDSKTGLSPGTAKTNIEGMAKGGKVRRNGKIETVSLGHHVRTIDFGDGPKRAMTIPWGDVSTAFHTTGIPNIEVFIPASTGIIAGAKLSPLFRPILSFSWLQKVLKNHIEKTVKGPEEASRSNLPTYVWGEARNAAGEVKTARVKTDNTYSLTITGALEVITHLLETEPQGGAYTPSRLVDFKLVSRLPGSGPIVIK